MGLFGKSNEEKLEKLRIKVQSKLLQALDLSKNQKHFEPSLLRYILNTLFLDFNQGKNITINFFQIIDAKEIELEIATVEKKLKLSYEEKIQFTHLLLDLITIIEIMPIAAKEAKRELDEKAFVEMLKNYSNAKIKEENHLERYGISKKIGMFKKKISEFQHVYDYYTMYLILKQFNLLSIVDNYLTRKSDTINLDNRGILRQGMDGHAVQTLQGLLIDEINNQNITKVDIPLNRFTIDLKDFKMPLDAIASQLRYEKIIFAKEEMKHKIEEFYDSKTIEDHLIGFLNIVGNQWFSQISYIVKIIQEKNPNWHENISELLLKKQHELEISGLKKSLTKKDFPEVDFMDGIEFEKFLGQLFEKMGFMVSVTKASGDQGTDLIIRKKSEIISVQAKRYSSKVTNTAVQEVVGSLKFYNATKGMVVTTDDFTKSAQELAKSNNVELINGKKLDQMIQQYW